MANRQIKKQLRNTIQRYGGEWLNERDAWLGNESETVETGTAGVLYARLANGDVVRVHNTIGAPSDFDLHVRIGENRHQRKIWQIIRVVEEYTTPAAGGRLAYHHAQHEFGGPDEVQVSRKQIVAYTVRVLDGAAFTVRVYGGYFPTPAGYGYTTTQTLDLSSYAVTAGAEFLGIETDDDGVLSVNEGSNFGSPIAGTIDDIPAPAPGSYHIAAVLLHEGQTELTDDDISVPMPLAIIPKSAGQQIHDAAADTPADTDEFGYWDATNDQMEKITYADLVALQPRQYRQFTYVVTGGDFSFIIDADGNPVLALQNLE